jgi:Protein of unknown function (DUF2721).
MDQASLTQSPFAVLTFIAAPALLTNSSSVLALSTINRMLRTRDRMKELFAQSQQGTLPESERERILSQVDRVEKQGLLLLSGLRAIYVALAAFAGATLVTLVGAALFSLEEIFWFHLLARLGLVFGFVGVGGLIFGTVHLFSATQLSVINIRQEAGLIREMQKTKSENPNPKTQ